MQKILNLLLLIKIISTQKVEIMLFRVIEFSPPLLVSGGAFTYKIRKIEKIVAW